jgi:hypothetical protein
MLSRGRTQRRLMKYRFFDNEDYALAWINGGVVRIAPAATYLSQERDGIMTPDERLIYESPIPFEEVESFGAFELPRGQITGATFTDNVVIDRIDGIDVVRKIPDLHQVKHYYEDVGVICLCNDDDPAVIKRMKKSWSVDIPDVEKVLSIISEQLGIAGEMGDCEYTRDHQRTHYLKSTADQWQDEFRLVFKGLKETRFVEVPPGLGQNLRVYYDPYPHYFADGWEELAFAVDRRLA